jgi:hypothetical protein
VPDPASVAEAVAAERSWNARVQRIRRIPEEFGVAQHSDVYAAVAQRVYVPSLKPDYAYVHWRNDYELPRVVAAYRLAHEGTRGFSETTAADLARTIRDEPATLLVFRLMLGFTGKEFAETCRLVSELHGVVPVGPAQVDRMENGHHVPPPSATTCAMAIDLVMRGELFPALTGDTPLRRKVDKPDTARGWESVRGYAAHGVPLEVFLHQRAYGGAFRQLLDATSTARGDVLEDPVDALFNEAHIPHIRTGGANQAEIERRFGLTVRPAPDFVIFDAATDTLRAVLECKGANDGGTARDKAARFRALRAEGGRLGGVPLFAVLGGLGWRRTGDALGPVVEHTDGRVFTLATLTEMLDCEPFPALTGTAP